MGLLDPPAAPYRITPYTADSQNYAAKAWRPWWAGLADRANNACDVVCIGNSLTEDLGKTSCATRWVELLRQGLQQRFPVDGVAGGRGYEACAFVNVSPASLWTVSGGSSGVTACPGLKFRSMNGAGQTLSLPFTGTGIDVCYHSPNVGSAVVGWSIDGGSVTNVNCSTNPTGSGRRIQISGLTRGDHTLLLQWVSGATVFIGGGMIFDGDEGGDNGTGTGGKGVRLWEFGHGGAQTSTFTANSNTYLEIATIQPKLVTIELGRNEAANSVSAATFKSNLTTFIAGIRNVCTVQPTIVLIGMYPSYLKQQEWPDYVTAMKQIVAADSSLLYFDLGPRMLDGGGTDGNTLSDPNSLLYSDGLHTSDKGSALIANELLDYLSGTKSGTSGLSVATSYRTTGKTGATAAAALVGGTTSGAPASGTFAVGDMVVDQSGNIRVCTVAGSPGTWVAPAGSGAATSLSFVTVSAESSLSAERVLTAGKGVTVTDSSGGGTITLATSVAASTSGKFGRTTHTSGSITVNGTSWANVDTGMDITLTGCSAGDVIEVGLAGNWGSEAVVGYLDVVTVVSSNPVNGVLMGTAPTNGDQPGAWFGPASASMPIHGTVNYALVSGDISGGSVLLRLRVRTFTAANKTLLGATAQPLMMFARWLG